MPDAIDRLLTIGSTPDWISHVVAIVQDFRNGPRHDFFLDLNAGWSVRDIKRLLKHHEIEIWGDMIVDDLIVFSVRQAQARKAQYILMQNDITIISGMIDGVKLKPKSATDTFFDWLFK